MTPIMVAAGRCQFCHRTADDVAEVRGRYASDSADIRRRAAAHVRRKCLILLGWQQ